MCCPLVDAVHCDGGCSALHVKRHLELHPLTEDVDADLVEQVTVDVGLYASLEATLADGQYLAHGIAPSDDALFIGIGSLDGVILDHFDNDGIAWHAAEEMGKAVVQQTLLPHAPQHPVVAEVGEVRSDLFLVLGLGASLGIDT